ncbi:MAG: VWA domain-containing protein [Alteromonadaceae bacterium]|jgi:Ca-activated chloride channel family protein
MADFHFIRPWWLLAIIALVFALNLLKKYRLSQSGWQQLLPEHLANVLVDKQKNQKKLSLTMPFIIGLLTIVAIAGPTWKKLPQPVYQTARGSVLIMDMSYSMYATDISPNRLTRSRYKAIDLLERLIEGETGLIAYAGDAFTISPLTDDINNIKLLLPSLSPELMPELGSNPLAALTLAHDMLINAGHSKGDIYWFTDGIDNYDIQDITDWSRSNNHRLNILGIGTKAGAPIKLNNGELMKDSGGSIIVPKLSISALQGSAKRGQGNYATLANNNNDIEQLLRQPFDIEEQEQKESSNTGDQWQEVGPYLLLLVLPLLLPYFRRGRLLAILPVFLLITPVDKSYAKTQTLPPVSKDLSSVETDDQVSAENLTTTFWDDLWQTKDQQGQKQFNSEAFQQAANSFENSSWQGSSFYRSGDYEQALKAFQQNNTTESLYNQGNALAQLKQIDEAIEAYDQALKKDPQHEDAKANKAYLEALKKQQEQQKDQQEQNKDKDKNQEQQDQESQNQDQEQKESDDPSQEDASEQKGDKKEGADKEPTEEEKVQEEEEQKKTEQEKESKESEAKEQSDEKSEQTPAQLRAAEKLAEETEQKHQQLLNKVTDDPYMLLRNKMQLEYQKRRNNRSSAKGTKQW